MIHLHVGIDMDHFAKHFDTLVDREKRLLGVVQESKHQPVEHSRPRWMNRDAVGNRVERSRIYGSHARRLGRQRSIRFSRGLIFYRKTWLEF